jgi:hypothetical protein
VVVADDVEGGEWASDVKKRRGVSTIDEHRVSGRNKAGQGPTHHPYIENLIPQWYDAVCTYTDCLPIYMALF